MRSNYVRCLSTISLVALSACSSNSALGPPATLVLSTPPDFSARVSKVEYESANGPAGPYSQYNAWVIIPPSTSSNAGVVVPTKMPVFARHNGQIYSSSASSLKVGDLIEVWHDITVAHGAVQGPPGAPTYTSTQVVIDQ
jgi:hypothetical protein